jgi:epoxide hydrolase-like predicted phosphatase
MIKAICFDLDGVYFTGESFQRFKKKISGNVSEKKSNDVLYSSQMMLDFKKGIISENEYWDYARRELKVEYTNQEIFKMLTDSYEVNPEVLEVVRKARRGGYQTCICSNNFVTRIRELNKKLKFLKDFDITVFSFQIGYLKPERKIFETLIKESKVKPEEILYSDDSQEKLAGAVDLGINAFLYENFQQFVSKLREYGVKV